MDGSTKSRGITLFKPIDWVAKITAIQHLSLMNHVVTAILAEHAGGKTSFVQLAKQTLDESMNVLCFQSKLSCKTEEVLGFLEAALSLGTTPEPKKLHDICNYCANRKQHCLFIIDDAQNLPQDFIEKLLQETTQQEASTFFHICLVADYTILPKLYALETQAFQDKIHTMALGGFTETETNTYVLNQLPASKQVSNTQLAAFYQETRGNMTRMNNQMTAFWGRILPQKVRSVSYLSTMGCFLLFSLGLYCFWLDLGRLPTGVLSETPYTTEIHSTHDQKLPKLPATLISQIPKFTKSASHQYLQNMLQNNAIEFKDSNEIDLENLVVLDKVVVLPKDLAEKHTKKKYVHVNVDLKKHKRIQTKKVMSVNQYTIQLLAGRNMTVLKQLSKAYPLKKDLKISKINLNGSTWYVLTLGKFANRYQAQAYMDKLPNQLLTLRPWIRSTVHLQT